jgi:hypothetical protein
MLPGGATKPAGVRQPNFSPEFPGSEKAKICLTPLGNGYKKSG